MKVSSEINLLKKVIIHKPDEGIVRVTPKKSAELLFDDIVYLPAMQAEHLIFADVLRKLIGAENVLETQSLLSSAIEADHNQGHLMELLEKIIAYEELPNTVLKTLMNLTSIELAEALITGYLIKDDQILFDPIPNFLFTRDIAVSINDFILITKAAKSARTRENFLTRYLIHNHPIFRDLTENQRVIDLNNLLVFPPSKKGEPVSMEGGDVMILNEYFLLVGISERTNDHAFHSLKNFLFAHDVIDNIVLVDIPSDRSFMHIDTIMTQIDEQRFVAYKPIIHEGMSSYVEVHRKNGDTVYYSTIQDFLLNEINQKIEFTWVGNGESPMQEREQWTDGCNLLTLKPGVAITYDRNPSTANGLKQAGYTLLSALDLLNNDGISLDQLNKTIITIPSGELSRARGGPHCMSCPIHRN